MILLSRALGNSLLERMHPPMVAKVNYVIKPGMDFGDVRSVLVAAGGVYSYAVHNAHASGPYRGYLMPDDTMVFLRLSGSNGEGDVVSIGVGPVGMVDDVGWNWNDPAANGLNQLELKPLKSRYPD